MINGKLSTINTPAQHINNAGAGYLSGTDPVGAFIVGNVVAGKPLAWLGKGLEYGAAKAGSQWARNRIVGREVKKRVSHLVPSNSTVPSNRISLPSNSPISTHRVFEGKNIFPSKTGDIPTYGNQSYRLTRTDQLKDILETGYVRPRAGKVKGGHEGEVFWSQGNKDFTYKPKDVVLETKPNTLPIGNSTNRVGINDLNKIYVNGTNILDGKIHPYKKGGIIKYQDGGRQDAIKDYKPTMPLKPIKRRFTPTYSEVSPDNKSKWQHQQDSQKADKAYAQYKENQKMQEGLHNLEGFLTFTDYAGLATGVGGLLTKGAKYAGKQVIKRIAKNRNLGIIAKSFQNSPFKSSLDWSPESWFEGAGNWKNYTTDDIAALKSHIPEYLQIEKNAKANGTWLKLSNGDTWKGDPRSWVQLMSENGQKWKMPNGIYKNGIKGDAVQDAITYDKRVWMSNHPEVYNSFANRKGYAYYTPMDKTGNTYQLTIPKKSKIGRVNAHGKDFENIEFNGKRQTTDQIVNTSKKYGNDATSIENVVEGPHYKTNTTSNDLVIHEGTPRKSLLGNNGNFDINDKNIYRGFIPLGILGGMNYGNRRNE